MRRVFFSLLLCLLFVFPAALADGLTLAGETAGEICYPEGSAAEDARYVYRYSYPLVETGDEVAEMINDFYAYLISDALDFAAPMMYESLEAEGLQAYTSVTSQVMCNSDAYFSVLVTTESLTGAETSQILSGHTFARTGGKAGSCISLPYLLGILDANESDTWMQERATAKANALVYGLIWAQIEQQRAAGDIAFDDALTEESFETLFYPEEDFYLDEAGNPVFFIQAGYIASTAEGVLTYAFTVEELLDEL